VRSNPRGPKLTYSKKRNKLIAALAFLLTSYVLHAVAAVEGYVIGPGDMLSINVYGEPELSLEKVRVSLDGMIPYPLLGRIQVVGHTVATLEKDITYKLKQGYLYRPQVTVAVVEFRPIYLKGNVKKPGVHTYTEGMTVEQAIALAGGIIEGSTLTEVSLTRDGADPIGVDLPYKIMPGDILNLATVEEKKETVVQESGDFIYLYGEVKQPGSFRYREGLTVEKAIALAGGFGPRASKRKIDISRDVEGEGSKKIKKVSLTDPVLPGDVITVGESWF